MYITISKRKAIKKSFLLHLSPTTFQKQIKQVNHGRPRRYYILGVIFFSFFSHLKINSQAQCWASRYCIYWACVPKNGESMRPPSCRCIDPLKKACWTFFQLRVTNQQLTNKLKNIGRRFSIGRPKIKKINKVTPSYGV